MSRKLKYNSASPFHDRLLDLIGDDVAGWSKRLGVTQGTITGRWFKGSFPGTDKIIKICEEARVSADWLLNGKERISAGTEISTDQNKEGISELHLKLITALDKLVAAQEEIGRLRAEITELKADHPKPLSNVAV
jgi:transcriptional regulator with XRE-family HTH domain